MEACRDRDETGRKVTPRRQHYVWRHYLSAWQNDAGLVHCSRNRRVLPPTNPINLMVERDYYKLARITKDDVACLETVIESTAPSALQDFHRSFVARLAHISAANEMIQNSTTATTDEKRSTEALVIQTEERLHSRIEQEALPLLEDLRQKRAEFVNDDTAAVTFFHFIAQQYFRTKSIREAIAHELQDYNCANIAHIVCQLAAINVGYSLFRERAEWDILFLERGGDLGFITGDQPVVNIMGTGEERVTRELILYYPLSPSVSCLVAPKEYQLQSMKICDSTAEALNYVIAWKSQQFLAAGSDHILQRILNRRVSGKPAIDVILEAIAERHA